MAGTQSGLVMGATRTSPFCSRLPSAGVRYVPHVEHQLNWSCGRHEDGDSALIGIRSEKHRVWLVIRHQGSARTQFDEDVGTTRTELDSEIRVPSGITVQSVVPE